MAGSLNKVMLIGRLGKDPELRYTAGGTPVANFSIATDENYTDKEGNRVERTEWHRIVVWSRQAETCANYLSKGRLVFIEGSIQTRQWQDKEGQTRYSTEIKADRVQFLDSKGQGGEAGDAPRPAPARRDNPPRPAGRPAPDMDEDLGPAFPSEASGMDEVPF